MIDPVQLLFDLREGPSQGLLVTEEPRAFAFEVSSATLATLRLSVVPNVSGTSHQLSTGSTPTTLLEAYEPK